MNYQHLKPYARPENYMGATWYGYYGVAGRHRDSDVLANSNWECWVAFLTRLLGEPDTEIGVDTDRRNQRGLYSSDRNNEPEPVYNWTICRESHWAVGWIEIIRVHESVGHDKLAAIDEQLRKLDGYPVFDEQHFSQLEDDERDDSWETDCRRIWVEWLAKHIGDQQFDLLASVYKSEIEELLRRAFDGDCRNRGVYWSEPDDDDYDIEQLVRDAEPHKDDRMERLIENLYAAERLHVVTE